MDKHTPWIKLYYNKSDFKRIMIEPTDFTIIINFLQLIMFIWIKNEEKHDGDLNFLSIYFNFIFYNLSEFLTHEFVAGLHQTTVNAGFGSEGRFREFQFWFENTKNLQNFPIANLSCSEEVSLSENLTALPLSWGQFTPNIWQYKHPGILNLRQFNNLG